MKVRVTRKTARLLRVLLNLHADREFELAAKGTTLHMSSRTMMEKARISVASFYPIISRLEAHGWVEGEWEELPEGVNRPRRRFYHLTPEGVTAAHQATAHDMRPWWRRIIKNGTGR